MHTFIDSLFIVGAKYLYLLSLVIVVVYFFKQDTTHKKHFAWYALVSLVAMFVVAVIAGHLFNNPRPFVDGNFTPLIPHAPNNGFPSDHTLLTAGLAAVLWFFSKRVSVSLWVIAILVGISRVYVGVHHPIDILGSIVIAIVVAAITWKLMKPRSASTI